MTKQELNKKLNEIINEAEHKIENEIPFMSIVRGIEKERNEKIIKLMRLNPNIKRSGDEIKDK